MTAKERSAYRGASAVIFCSIYGIAVDKIVQQQYYIIKHMNKCSYV